jgi:hypothetical protein
MQWIVADDPNLSRFVMSRLDVALAYLGIADPA